MGSNTQFAEDLTGMSGYVICDTPPFSMVVSLNINQWLGHPVAGDLYIADLFGSMSTPQELRKSLELVLPLAPRHPQFTFGPGFRKNTLVNI